MQRSARITIAVFAIAAVFFASGVVPIFAGEPSMGTRPNANEVGIWKAYVPHGMHGEFKNLDPIGLISGTLVHSDCSINWSDPDTDKLYCFSSTASLLSFQRWPKAKAREASDALERMKKEDLVY